MRRRPTPLPLLVAIIFASPGLADDYPLDPRVDVLAYRFALQLSDTDDAIAGDATVRVALRADGVEAVTLDLVGGTGPGMAVSSAAVDGVVVPFTHVDNRLTIAVPPAARHAGEIELRVIYSGVPADGLIIGNTKHGRRAFFGDNYPDRARHWLPTIDHVADKATVEFVVTAPDHYQVIGVAEFAIQRIEPVRGVPVESWVYPQDRDAGFHDFALARPILDFFIDRVGPYSYAKLANVQSTTRYGGMENAGNIFYNENAVRGDRSNEGLLAHEIAHQWFGDSVSEADWHHVWLSEGFATYFTQLYADHAHGRERLVAGMRSARARVIRYHASSPGYAIVDERFGMTGLLNANSYQKGGWVLHMLRREIGDEVFWRGIRDYYARFRDGNALTEDFRDAMQEAAGADLGWFFDQWAYRPGHPQLTGSWNWHDGTVCLQLRQLQEQPFRIAVDVGLIAGDGTRTDVTLRFDGATASFEIPSPAAPAELLFDPDTWLLFEDAGMEHER